IRRQLCKVLLDLSLDYDVIPSSLILKRVELTDRHSIGHGSSGDIYKATLDQQPIALKRLRVFSSNLSRVKQEFLHEGLVWRNLKHRHILPFLGIDATTFSPVPCMVLPWMPNGSIGNMINNLKAEGKMTSSAIFLEIAQGLAYLHREGVIHADLRGPNILVDSDWGVRIADFGLATLTGMQPDPNSQDSSGNIRWSSPELLDCSAVDGGEDMTHLPTFASDIYSFACVIIELFTCQIPFAGLTRMQVLIRVPRDGIRPSRPYAFNGDGPGMSDALWSLVCRCWAQNPVERP
ncbi:kinase-like protein, partial [Panus rudis PR-1116 ss-1]